MCRAVATQHKGTRAPLPYPHPRPKVPSPPVTTGYRFSILLLCSPSERRVVDRLAGALGEAGLEAVVQSVAPGTEPVAALAVALTAALEQAALVLVAVSAEEQALLDALLGRPWKTQSTCGTMGS